MTDGPDKQPQETAWPYSIGRIDGGMMAQHLFPSGPDTIAAMCGPPGMVNYACLPNFKIMEYPDANCIVF